MLPIPPLDGSRVLGGFLPQRIYNQYMALQRYSDDGFICPNCFGGGFIGRILSFVAIPIDYILRVPGWSQSLIF